MNTNLLGEVRIGGLSTLGEPMSKRKNGCLNNSGQHGLKANERVEKPPALPNGTS